MNKKRSRSPAWAMVNWAVIEQEVKGRTTLLPESSSIENAITEIENKYDDQELLLLEAQELEQELIKIITNNLYQKYSKEIKRNKTRLERERRARKQSNSQRPDVRLLKVGSLDELKDLGLDPEMMEQLSKGMMDQLFGKKRKKDSDDEDDEEDDPGASFYL